MSAPASSTYPRLSSFSFRYDLFFPLAARLPPAAGHRLCDWLAEARRPWLRDHEFHTRAHMRSAFPDASHSELEHWLSAYRRMVERAAIDVWYMRSRPISEFMTLVGFESVVEARRQGRRVLATTGHCGDLFLGGYAVRAAGHTCGTLHRDNLRENVHGLPPAEFRFQRSKLRQMEANWGGPFVAEGEDLRKIYRGLERHPIVILFDVPYATPPRGLVEVPFLGGTAQLPAGVYRIAKKMEALIAPVWIGPSGDGPAVTEFQPLIDPHDHDEQSLLSLLAGQLESRIRANPGNWWNWTAMPLFRPRPTGPC
jgi:lauroyl/myristoyl acyltransferase